MRKAACCRNRTEAEDSRHLALAFRIFLVIHTITLIVLYSYVVHKLGGDDVFWFLPYDLESLVIAVIVLNLLICFTGYAAASTETVFNWLLFHLFVMVLLLVEIVTAWFSSDVNGLVEYAHSVWEKQVSDDIEQLEEGLGCCGFDNITDRPVGSTNCSYTECCRAKMHDSMSFIRDTGTLVLFMDFVLVMFMDFAGCAICFHPTTLVRLADDGSGLIPTQSLTTITMH